jgi:hypothetical protein
MIIVETFDGARPARSPSPTRSGSTPHDNRRASRLAMLIAFASPRAPEQERDALTTSADSLQLLRSHPREATGSSRSAGFCRSPRRLIMTISPGAPIPPVWPTGSAETPI